VHEAGLVSDVTSASVKASLRLASDFRVLRGQRAPDQGESPDRTTASAAILDRMAAMTYREFT
jgi:hypothetical protein